MSLPNFWDDNAGSNRTMKELKALKAQVEPFETAVKKVKDLKELTDLSHDDPDLLKQIQVELAELERQVGLIEVQTLLAGQFDRNNAILSINAGAGGTESCDWASMLLRMYTRWADSKNYKVKTLDILSGDEAGIKNVTLSIEGDLAYGFLKCEKGVHRLVRISPFDSNKRRHTSFVSIDVIPEIEDDVEIEINPDDLRIDVYRSSGAGGQSVNTADSAVRITHIPSGFVVACQNERSQLQNKQSAMRVLKAKLYELKLRQQQDTIDKERGVKQKIEWGSQIRSYVMQPYTMVKDHRTDAETGSVQKVLDGDIDLFIEAFLKQK